ncbi:MAG: hypothetical protein U5L98_18325 [Halomonas sp.]|uniref:hypothetical protein n=1 Tax=Halomonas sp. TaxID=1486246 RepID=UPI002ACEC16C|nr:hypothetical protein [Halomonas sp.]MDZ7854529.1 hypothetical protein [Halomonas sp.]
MFVQLGDTQQTLVPHQHAQEGAGADPAALAQAFAGDEPGQGLALGAINAIGQHLLLRSGYEPDFTTNSLALFEPQPGERIGMVGTFRRSASDWQRKACH